MRASEITQLLPTNIFRIYRVGLGLKLNQKQTTKIRKRKLKQKEQEPYLPAHLSGAYWFGLAQPSPLAPLPVISHLCQKAEARHGARPRALGHLLLPPGSPGPSTSATETPEDPVPSPSLAALPPFPWLSLSRSPSGARRRRPLPPRPPGLPRFPD